MARKKTNPTDLYILFEVMSPSEIRNIFPEYESSVRVYYIRWKEAKERVAQKLTIQELAKRVFWGTEKA